MTMYLGVMMRMWYYCSLNICLLNYSATGTCLPTFHGLLFQDKTLGPSQVTWVAILPSWTLYVWQLYIHLTHGKGMLYCSLSVVCQD